MAGSSDERLAALLHMDPQQGYAELTDQYLGFVYKIMYSKLSGSCSKEDIEESVCDIFYEFYCNRDKINLEKGSIKALLSVFAKRRAINLFHKMTKGKESISFYDDKIQHLLIDHKNAENQVLETEKKTELLKIIKGLGSPDCEIVLRKHYYGQTLKEISIDLGMKAKTVEKRYERALKKLQKAIGGVGNERKQELYF